MLVPDESKIEQCPTTDKSSENLESEETSKNFQCFGGIQQSLTLIIMKFILIRIVLLTIPIMTLRQTQTIPYEETHNILEERPKETEQELRNNTTTFKKMT